MSQQDPHAQEPESSDDSDFPEFDDEPTIIIDADLVEEIQGDDPGYSVRPRQEEAGDSPVTEPIPSMDESPVTEQIPSFDDAPVTEAIPSFDDAPVTEAIPSFDEAPVTEAIPSFDEAPVTEAIPSFDDAPVTEQIPLMDQLPGGHGSTEPMGQGIPTEAIGAHTEPVGGQLTEEITGGDLTVTENMDSHSPTESAMDVGLMDHVPGTDDMLVLVDGAPNDTETIGLDDLPELDNIEDITTMLDEGEVQLEAPVHAPQFGPFTDEPVRRRRRSLAPALCLMLLGLAAAGIYFETYKKVPYLAKLAEALEKEIGFGGSEDPVELTSGGTQDPDPTDPGTVTDPVDPVGTTQDPVATTDPTGTDKPVIPVGGDHTVFRTWLGGAVATSMATLDTE